jgi:dextranase
LRCTVVQVYDWMESYSAPLGAPSGWKDPLGRDVSFQALRDLAAGIQAQVGVAHAYAPLYAVDPPFAARHPNWLIYRGDGSPERLFEGIQLADPSNPEWQAHFCEAYGRAAETIGFGGFHLDTYGFPRAGLDRRGKPLNMRAAYVRFLRAFRAARPSELLSFNQVNGVPSALPLPKEPAFRYCEIWPPNDRWRHFEGLLDRSAGLAAHLGPAKGGPLLRGTLACYPPVWGAGRYPDKGQGYSRADALRTVVLTEAVATCLGASLLVYGDRGAALADAYYPKHERLAPAELATALAWHRFALACRDLFLEGEDTSWYDICDDNGAVKISWEGGPVGPEPLGGSVFARVARDDNYIAVSVLDLSGSENGSWSEPARRGRCSSVSAQVLLDAPQHWRADVAVLGRNGGRFVPVGFSVVSHREGLAAQVEVPVKAGWSVLRLLRTQSSADPSRDLPADPSRDLVVHR